MSQSHGDISDALRNMADGEHDHEQADGEAEHVDAVHKDDPADTQLDVHEDAMLEDEAGDFVAVAPPSRQAASDSATRRTTKRRKKKGEDPFKATAVPVLFTVGGLLLLIGIWALLLLFGIEVPMHQRSGARQMAIAMLVCWPVGLALMAGGILFHKQIQQAKKQNDG